MRALYSILMVITLWLPTCFSQRALVEANSEDIRVNDLKTAKLLVSDDFKSHFRTPFNNGGYLGWYESYKMMGSFRLYQKTGDAFFLKQLIKKYHSIYQMRDDQRGVRDELRDRITKGWSSTKYSSGKKHAWIVHSGMILYPITKAISALLENKNELSYLYSESKLEEIYQQVKEASLDFEEDWNSEIGFYNYRYRLGQHLPYNQGLALGRVFIMLAKVADQLGLEEDHLFFKDRSTKMAGYFKSKLKTRNKMFSSRFDWNYGDHEWQNEDNSHAGIDVDFAVLAYENKIVFKLEDIMKFTNTYHHMTKDEGFARYVNGKGDTEWLEGLACGRWLSLARFSEGIHQKCENIFKDFLLRKGLNVPYGFGNNFIMGYINLIFYQPN